MGLEIELNLTDEAGDPAMLNADGARGDRRPRLHHRARRSSTSRSTSRRGCWTGDGVLRARAAGARQPQRAEDKARGAGAHMMLVGILPTIADAAPQRRGAEREPALQAAQRADLRRPRGGPADLDRGPGAAVARSPTRSRPRPRARACSCTSRSTPSASPRIWNAAQAIAGVQLAVGANSPFFFGARAVAGDADRAVRAGDRHAPGGAQGPGRAPARLVRRALDHVDLRPLRGERPLLPGAAAGVRAGGPGRGARARRRPAARRAAPAQRHRLPLEPAGLRRRARQAAPARREPRAAGRPDRGRHARQRRLLLRARAHAGRARSARSGRGCRSRPPRRTSTPARATASTRACSGPGSARCRRPSSCCGGCSRSPTRGSSAGASTRTTATGCSGSSSSAASTKRNGATWQAETFHRLYDDEGIDREQALREMTVRYRDLMHANEPVHDWPVGG